MTIFAERKNAAALSCMLLIEPCRAPYDVCTFFTCSRARRKMQWIMKVKH